MSPYERKVTSSTMKELQKIHGKWNYKVRLFSLRTLKSQNSLLITRVSRIFLKVSRVEGLCVYLCLYLLLKLFFFCVCEKRGKIPTKSGLSVYTFSEFYPGKDKKVYMLFLFLNGKKPRLFLLQFHSKHLSLQTPRFMSHLLGA